MNQKGAVMHLERKLIIILWQDCFFISVIERKEVILNTLSSYYIPDKVEEDQKSL